MFYDLYNLILIVCVAALAFTFDRYRFLRGMYLLVPGISLLAVLLCLADAVFRPLQQRSLAAIFVLSSAIFLPVAVAAGSGNGTGGPDRFIS